MRLLAAVLDWKVCSNSCAGTSWQCLPQPSLPARLPQAATGCHMHCPFLHSVSALPMHRVTTSCMWWSTVLSLPPCAAVLDGVKHSFASVGGRIRVALGSAAQPTTFQTLPLLLPTLL